MTDLEITRMCAKAMGLETVDVWGHPHIRHSKWYDRDTSDEHGALKAYNPLTDDAQAMALVKRFGLNISYHYGKNIVRVSDGLTIKTPYRDNLNKAICECVVKMVAWNGGAGKREAA